MNATLHELQHLIHSGGGAESRDPLLRRLASTLNQCKQRREADFADLAGLVRHALLRADLANEQPRELVVPVGAGWPSPALWERFSFDVTRTRVGNVRIRPRAWAPPWLDQGASAVVEAAVRAEPRRRSREVLADPALTEQLGWRTYSSPGQREAVRAAFLTPSGATTIVNLPTGAGKSLSFQLAALTWRAERGLVVVVVPTVALARDQEARFRSLLTQSDEKAAIELPLAYHSGLDEQSRAALKRGIRNGELPIVFVSPEAAVGALRDPLFAAAAAGRLKLFAVDEAHLIAQWGDEFRPEFQALGGLRDALLRMCPTESRFRTLLYSATLTAETLDTLRAIFGREHCELVCELALRNEIGFLLSRASEEQTRTARIAEAIDHLPRPLVLYTTLREHAELWSLRLRERGYLRVRLVRGGDLSDEAGTRILSEWRDGSIDIVVATSAFGLGMDQSEVRSIVHACLPETVDRYYQEVGRAGRDGNAAVALLVSAPEDERIACDLGTKRRISIERGFERWHAMWWSARRRMEGTSYVLPLDTSPPDISSPGERSEAWNMRTLVLMARAQLIEFAAHAAPAEEAVAGEAVAGQVDVEAARKRLFERYAREVAVRLLDGHHDVREHWDEVVASVRDRLRAQDRAAGALANELNHLERPLNEVFGEAYRLSNPKLRPTRLLGNCPMTRARGQVDFFSVDPECVSFTRSDVVPTARLQELLSPCIDGGRRAWIAYPAIPADVLGLREWRQEIQRLLQYFVAQGVLELCVPDLACERRDWSRLLSLSPSRFLLRSDPWEPTVPSIGARVTVLPEHCDAQAMDRVMTLPRSLHIILLPEQTPDPWRPRQRFLDRVLSLTTTEIKTRLNW